MKLYVYVFTVFLGVIPGLCERYSTRSRPCHSRPIAWLIPRVGAGSVMIALLAGLVLGGLILSHFGWSGSPVQPITGTKVLGVVVMIAGVVLATYSK